MKRKITFIFCIILSQFLNAQDPLNVIITGSCQQVSGIYSYIGMLNGKNNYISNFDFGGGNTINAYIHYDDTFWILNIGEDITNDILFYNTDVSTSIVPPSNNWILANCTDGSMTITEILANNQFEKNKILIYPNPSLNYIIVKNNINSKFSYKIIDYLGRIIIEESSNYNQNIDLKNLDAGNYVIQIRDENDNLLNMKFIKKY